ncbi:hypothetical protein OEZ85_013905 [Tetradesmus obliquus]|uniref:Gamma-butyrobetaine hydroxylase-like N-terminal domain-containing protein n=1 Tax=Tetradesmus obliquus TaxID=3088 RepID=A0ABY8U6A1_TETOB|nr:hypothetical protein OEZ85_013905 [Tetradesmus obliquus]
MLLQTARLSLLRSSFYARTWFRELSGAVASQTGSLISVTALHLHKKEKVLEVTFSDGSVRKYSAELLRVCSPSAENCSTGGNMKVAAGRRHVGIMGLEPVGNYAVRINFDDLHSTGLYTWDYLRDLGQHKFSRAKQYIAALREQGASRDPRKLKPKTKQ